MKTLKLVLLFDVDGTLIKSGGAGKMAMEEAFHELFKIPDAMKELSFAGSTDLGIFEAAQNLHLKNHTSNSLESTFRNLYLKKLQSHLLHHPQGQEVLPGVIEFLQHCQQDDDIYLGLVTGNYKHGSDIKLNHFNLNQYFQQGAFGCDFADRNLLPPLALERIESSGYQLPPREKIWIIGDTTKDVQCAQKNGLNSWIVFTGFNTREEILASQPTLTTETLEGYKDFLKQNL